MKISFPQIYEHYYVVLSEENKTVRIDFPAVVQLLGKRNYRVRYDSVREEGNKFTAQADVKAGSGYVLRIKDIRTEGTDGNILIDRMAECISAEQKEGVRVSTEFRIADGCADSFDDYHLIVPGAVYNKNDTDLDGVDDYLGTFNQDYRDDRNPGLSETAWCSKSGNRYALIRTDLPVRDKTLTRQQIAERHFIHDTDVGSLGFAPSPYKTSEMIFRCDYPFYERNCYCLNVDGSEWSGYREMQKGDRFTVSYVLLTGKAKNLTDAGWQTSVYQMDHIMNENIKLPFSIEDSKECRTDLVFNSYREFPDKKDYPAGFFIHFSPREAYGKQNILEYGFTGQQQMLCYAMLRAADDLKSEIHRERVLKTIDFFMKKCIHPSGIPYGMYDVNKEDYIFWWTGVLFPFQYSQDREQLEKYLGVQVASAILPIAEELKKNDGNYTRTMIDSMYYLWLCYEEEKKRGIVHKDWKEAVIKFCDTFAAIQNTNGSWNRGYTMDGRPLTLPKEWFGSNEPEQGSGVIFPIEIMMLIYHETGDKKYLESCKRAADFICRTYVADVTYVGGLNDTTHKKSVKIDAVGVMFAMRSMLLVYEETKEDKYLEGAADAAKVLASWTYLWDVPFDEDTLLGRHGFKTTGWAVCDAIPAGSYVDDEFMEFIPDLLRIAGYKKDIYLAKLAKIVFLGMQHGTSTHTDMHDYALAGAQCEGYLTSLWLSDTQDQEFSGAVAKLKGDDNDTCNGLVNGQQLAAMNGLLAEYGTMDMDCIIERIMK